MTNEEILHKAIEKAVKNGLESEYIGYGDFTEQHKVDFFMPCDDEYGTYDEEKAPIILYSHDFAKAFWGEDNQWRCPYCEEYEVSCPAWQYHLQQMVLEENPIKYLEKFI